MEVVRFVACICLVIAPAVAIESALKNQGLDTRAVCSVQELSTRLFDSFCEHGQPLVDRLARCGANSFWSQFARLFVLLCKTNEQGMQCGDFVIATATDLLPTTEPLRRTWLPVYSSGHHKLFPLRWYLSTSLP